MTLEGETAASSLDALPDSCRRELGAHWLRRAHHEWLVGSAFADLTRGLRGWAEPSVVTLLELATVQEREHSAQCHELAERYAGRALSLRPLLPVLLPDFSTGDERLELSLNVVGLCCINETIATAWLSHCLELATVPFVVAANRGHLADEIDHARLGWAHLASSSVSAAQRDAIAERLPSMLRVNLAEWERDANFLPGEALPAHGQPSASSAREVIRRARHELLLPGFHHVGFELANGGCVPAGRQ